MQDDPRVLSGFDQRPEVDSGCRAMQLNLLASLHCGSLYHGVLRWMLDIDRLWLSRQIGTTPPLPRSLVQGAAGYVCEMEINRALVNMRAGVDSGMRG